MRPNTTKAAAFVLLAIIVALPACSTAEETRHTLWSKAVFYVA